MALDASGFVEEIEFQELSFQEIVGRGAFGVVSRAQYRGYEVAVKLIETESEKKAFITELKQLSRVSHPNIVQLYGASTKHPVCLVMEYAEGGSLYNVLHGAGPQPDYSSGHAMSWALQCARGVEYLHSMKPKPLVHRDLKPPNLLLVSGGTILKICDFGTACDAQTHMTNNKGSAAWMAPEVFEGNSYSEKCDVFSWGIILWEVITRRRPFDEIGGPAFRIMWAVHNGTRPPLIKNCPKPIEILMTRCWAPNPSQRPSMLEVVRIMEHLSRYFTGGDVRLVYPTPEPEEPSINSDRPQQNSVFDTPPMTNQSQVTTDGRGFIGETLRQTLRHQTHTGQPVHVVPPQVKHNRPLVVEEPNFNRQASAPASLAASRESLLDGKSRSSTPSMDVINKRYSADMSKFDKFDIFAQGGTASPVPPPNHSENKKMFGHRRTGSHGTASITPSNTPPHLGHRRTGSWSNTPTPPEQHSGSQSPIHHSSTAPELVPRDVVVPRPAQQQPLPAVPQQGQWEPGVPVNVTPGAGMNLPGQLRMGNNTANNLSYIAMDHQLQPLAPAPTCPESMDIFHKHCQFAQDYLRVQTEIALLTQRKHDLVREWDKEQMTQITSDKVVEEYSTLVTENEELEQFRKNLQRQVDTLKHQQPNRFGGM